MRDVVEAEKTIAAEQLADAVLKVYYIYYDLRNVPCTVQTVTLKICKIPGTNNTLNLLIVKVILSLTSR